MSGSKTSRSRAWIFPTSPRSPYKLQGELKLLKAFDGRIWDKSAQLEFANSLARYEGFEGNVSRDDKAFSARDRLRGPRLMGFICTQKRGTKNGKLEFTTVGNLFLNATEEQQESILQRQIAKVQYRSPLHDNKGFEDMNVRPLMLMIKLLLELERMSKEEVALFALTLTDFRKFDSVVAEIKKYRNLVSRKKAGIERKTFRKDFATEYVNKIYKDDIENGRTKLREGGKDFSRTKYQTLRDYADSSIRYLRATGLFTLLPHGQILTLTKAKLDDSLFLLDKYGIHINEETGTDHEDYIKNYLGNPSVPVLRIDKNENQKRDFEKMYLTVKQADPVYAEKLQKEFLNAGSGIEKINTLARIGKKITDIQVKTEAKHIRDNFVSSLNDIRQIFEDIVKKKDIVDRSLMYEWNTWRSMVLINDALNVQGNYHADADGNPVSTASGNMPDILCEYDSFWLAVEVTLQSGMRQFESEGESIIRHIGQLQKSRISAADKRPVFGLFIAEKINPEVISHLYFVASRSSQYYEGKVRILPIERRNFIRLTESALKHPNFNSKVLLSFFENMFDKFHFSLEAGELNWFDHIQQKAADIHLNP